MADEGAWKGVPAIVQRVSGHPGDSVIVIPVYGGSEPSCPRLGGSFQERLVPWVLGFQYEETV